MRLSKVLWVELPIGLVPCKEMGPEFPFSALNVQQDDIPPNTSKRALSRNQIGWHIDLELPRLQNPEKKMFVV